MNKSIIRNFKLAWRAFCVASITGCFSSMAMAQLEITEVMFDPIDESNWEWIEVRNLGATDVDLNGAWMDRLGDNALDTVAFSPNVENTVAENTIIPAGGVAVLYDGFVSGGSPANFVDQNFRNAWGLSASVPLVGVSFFPFLTNGRSAERRVGKECRSRWSPSH